MSRNQSVHRQPRQSVGIAKAIAKFNELQAGFASGLADKWSERDRHGIFALSYIYMLRDDWHGSKLFDMPELGRVANLLFRSAGIQASWKDIGHIERSLDQLIPDMPGLVVKLLAYKTIIRDKPIFAEFDALLPDRFLVAVFEAFRGDQPATEFFTAHTPYDLNSHKRTDFAGLIGFGGVRHG